MRSSEAKEGIEGKWVIEINGRNANGGVQSDTDTSRMIETKQRIRIKGERRALARMLPNLNMLVMFVCFPRSGQMQGG